MSGNRIRTCVRRRGYEPDELLKFKIKKAPDFSEAFSLSSGNRTRTCVRRGGYEPDEL
jgi:hypothetical protein